MSYNYGSAAEVLENVFEVIEGGQSATVTGEVIADNGAKIFDIATKEVYAANGSAAEVAEVVSVAEGSTAGTTAGAGILAMDVGVAGAAIAPALGILAGIGLYNLAPDFWTNVSNQLVEAGQTVKGKVQALLMPDGTTAFSKDTIEIFKNAFLNYNVFNDYRTLDTNQQSITLDYIQYMPDVIVSDKGAPQYACYKESDYYIFNAISGGEITFITYFITQQNRIAYALVTASRNSFEYNYNVSWTTSNKNNRPPLSQSGTPEAVSLHGHGFYFADIVSSLSQFDDDNFLDGTTNLLNIDYSIEGIIKEIAYALLYGNSIDYSNAQPNATLPQKNIDITITYPNWSPIEYPSGLPSELPDYYPVSIPTPDITQDPSQSGENATDSQLNKLIELLFNSLPEPDPQIEPDPDAGIEPDPEPSPRPDPQPNPPDPNKPLPTPSSGVVIPTLDTTRADRMFTVYNPTDAEVNSLGAFLWTSSIIEQIKKLWDDPMQAIITFHKIYGAPTVGSSKEIVLGYIESGVNAAVVTSQFCEVDCGSVTVPELLNNATSYSPFTSLHIYLPFVGIMELDTNECMNATLHVKYRIDVYTGTCIAIIYVSRTPDLPNEQMLYTFSGNASQQLPLTSSSFGGAISALLGLAGAGVAVASGGALGVAAGAVSAAHSLTQEMVHINRSGGLSANAGILAPRKPYLILSRQYSSDANGYAGFYGYPSNKTVYIGNCNGYIKCKDVIFRGSCTQAEVEEIESLLKSGVYV